MQLRRRSASSRRKHHTVKTLPPSRHCYTCRRGTPIRRSYCILPRAAPDCPSRQDGRDDQDDNRYQSTATPGQSFVGVDCGEERAITCTRTYHATCSGVATGRAEVYPRPSMSYAAPERAASLASSSANARERAAAISSAKTAEA